MYYIPKERVAEGIIFYPVSPFFVCHRNSSKTAEQNFVKLCSYEGILCRCAYKDNIVQCIDTRHQNYTVFLTCNTSSLPDSFSYVIHIFRKHLYHLLLISNIQLYIYIYIYIYTKTDPAPAHRARAPRLKIFEIFDSKTRINFIVINMQCLLFVPYSLLSLKKHRVCVKGHQNNFQTTKIIPRRDRAPGS